MSATAETPVPTPSVLSRLSQPKPLIILILLMWVPLIIYVMFGHMIEDTKNIILMPAVPVTILLYVLAVRGWWESKIAVIGATLVFFWLLMAVSAPFLHLIHHNGSFSQVTVPVFDHVELVVTLLSTMNVYCMHTCVI